MSNRDEKRTVLQIFVETDRPGSRATRTVSVDEVIWTAMSEAERERYVHEAIVQRGLIKVGYTPARVA